jgi:beta-galactosidase
LITPDRKPHPGLYEVKKVYQDVIFREKDLKKGTVTIENRFHYTDLKEFDFKWELIHDGKKIDSGDFPVAQAPLTTNDVVVPFPKIGDEGEYFLNVFAYTRKASEMVPAGHEIAREQFVLLSKPVYEEYLPYNKVQVVKDDDNTLSLQANDVQFVFNKRKGSLTGISYKGKFLVGELQPDFWRAPTDNDYGNRMPEISNVWRLAGKNTKLVKFEASANNSDYGITVEYLLADVSSSYKIHYSIFSSGRLRVNVSWQAGRDDLPEMPRFGMQMQLNSDLENVEYYGRGPWENYADRNTSSFIGIYNSTVSEMGFDYIRPQENGNRTDVRWITLTDRRGKGITVEGFTVGSGKPLSVKAAHNTTDDLDFGVSKKNTHPSDVTPRRDIFLNVDYLQRGLGGDDSWGRLPHEPYRLLSKEYGYEFEITVSR